ncbi:metallo-beta-lactamase [Melioribacter roseus P3M-2]|uniref:Metallo-beta-lactamase n=1 Tax=Melioribacter roseus (strain DSM 23840 / JCM 17771 / VKM B-2668 / P3M-2) TaxID=1191523 RepID=I6YZ24_MELRP|nr:MBL fold metallo-hydrolase [Melioribacter roseus]AFN75827.1 metallo-beta-lactamase [Melioribacter roseus P3M-2]
MISIKKFVFNLFAENTYLIWDDLTFDAAIIDPGCSTQLEKETLSDFIELNGIKLRYLFNTHCHIDHILGNRFVYEKFNPQFYAPEKDLFLLDLMKEVAAGYGMEFEESPKPDFYIDEKLDLQVGNSKLKFIFTPGHTPGEFSIYLPDEKICFTGDVLFQESIGRTDLWGGNYNQLIESIKSGLLTLPEDVIIYPGHGESSTIGREKEINPFLI